MARRYSDTDPLRDPVTGALNRAEFYHRLKGWLAVALSFAILLGGLGVAAYKGHEAWVAFQTKSDYPGPGGGDIVVEIPKDTTVLGIGRILEKAKVVKSADKFQGVASSRSDEAKKLQAGRYKLQTGVPAKVAFEQLLDPNREVKIKLQLKEGHTLAQQKAAIAAGTKIPAAQIETWFRQSQGNMGLPLWANTKAGALAPQGFLFPDTYEVPLDVKPGDMPKLAIAEFNAVAKKMDFENQAKETSVKDPYKVLIVASIIEKEVFRPEDRTKVARVIYNRLEKRQRLEMDSTVAYAVNKKERTVRTTKAERETNSPYNTYRYRGLPPTPIAAPGEAALDAALHPAEGKWLYFTAVDLDTGETRFSTTKDEHDRNVAQFNAWCAAKPANQAKCGG